MNPRLLQNNVLIELCRPNTTARSGILAIPTTIREDTLEGVVRRVGRSVNPDIIPGDRVILMQAVDRHDFSIQDRDYTIVQDRHVLAKLTFAR